ncbi:Hypothetical predicted protein [Scomber scombrus]|uniref:Ig-like domain-containing protein n=1 Tax=Scomber scombrus TaxID=13677 RepID=A0AAV1PDW3_SCOSC
MDGLHVFLVVLLGVVACSHDGISGSVLEVTVTPGDNITLFCDCKKTSTGVYIVWYRNCSHENQPSLVLRTRVSLNPFPRFHLVKNTSSESYDLMIRNISDLDAGLYYCGTEQTRVEDKELIEQKHLYEYGNVTTRIVVDSSELPPECSSCCTLLFSLCPTSAVLSSLLSSLLVYCLCQKSAKKPQVDEQTPDIRGQTRLNQGEDVCYAALEIRQASQRLKKKKTADFNTYSAIIYTRL